MAGIDLRNPKLRAPALVGLIMILGGYLWYQQLYEPMQQEKEQLNGTFKSKQDELNAILNLKPQLNILQADIRSAQVKLDSLRSIFPDQKEIPKLIREITAVARASGIYTTRFNPLPDMERDYFIENRYNLAITGGYHELAQFFTFLAGFQLIINLSSVTINVNPSIEESRIQYEEQGTMMTTIVASFDMTTFSSKR